MKLKKIYLSENETSSMLNRYCFDEESISKIQNTIQRNMEELNVIQEQKEYEEMNYQAICKRMYHYTIYELIKELFNTLLMFRLKSKEQEN